MKELCLLVPSHQSSVASGQFGMDFQGAKSFERNLKSPSDRFTQLFQMATADRRLLPAPECEAR